MDTDCRTCLAYLFGILAWYTCLVCLFGLVYVFGIHLVLFTSRTNLIHNACFRLLVMLLLLVHTKVALGRTGLLASLRYTKQRKHVRLV